MKITAKINGTEITIDLRVGEDKTNYAAIKRACIDTGKTFKESEIFTPNFPEKGRSLIKNAGFMSLSANG